jgi:hypothetical protein
MAFNELDLQRIERIVGGFCRRRTRPEHADELRLLYEVDGQSVVISEERPDWRDPAERMHTPVAKLRFARTSGLWTLYWMRADLKWHAVAGVVLHCLRLPWSRQSGLFGRFCRSIRRDCGHDGGCRSATAQERLHMGVPVRAWTSCRPPTPV